MVVGQFVVAHVAVGGWALGRLRAACGWLAARARASCGGQDRCQQARQAAGVGRPDARVLPLLLLLLVLLLARRGA